MHWPGDQKYQRENRDCPKPKKWGLKDKVTHQKSGNQNQQGKYRDDKHPRVYVFQLGETVHQSFGANGYQQKRIDASKQLIDSIYRVAFGGSVSSKWQLEIPFLNQSILNCPKQQFCFVNCWSSNSGVLISNAVYVFLRSANCNVQAIGHLLER
jgi:hypothetical protein